MVKQFSMSWCSHSLCAALLGWVPALIEVTPTKLSPDMWQSSEHMMHATWASCMHTSHDACR